MCSASFSAGATYDNVYFLAADAAGYSDVVRLNPRDRAAKAFDLLRERLVARARERAAKHGCARVELWGWRGDGGLLVVHDDNESTALDVALETGQCMLTTELDRLREESQQAGLTGGVHIRMAIHKGVIRYPALGDSGAIHSPDINFTVHLEQATPRDCLAISESVHEVCGRYADMFEPVGSYEGRSVYLMRTGGRPGDGRRAWLRNAGLASNVPVRAFAERPSQQEKARLIDVAVKDVLDLGAALNTCAGYLVTTERPARYRDAVLDFLRRGGTYRCVLLDPSSDAAGIYARLRREDLTGKISRVMASFARFKERYGREADGLQVYRTSEFPGLHALCIDLHAPHALILYSPYLFGICPETALVERADMPHYLATTESGRLFTTLSDVISNASAQETSERVL
jgi:hypothetical protein